MGGSWGAWYIGNIKKGRKMNNNERLAELLKLKKSIWVFNHINRPYKAYTKEQLLEKVKKDFCCVDETWYDDFREHKLDFKNPRNFVGLSSIFCDVFNTALMFDGNIEDYIESIWDIVRKRGTSELLDILQLKAKKIEWLY